MRIATCAQGAGQCVLNAPDFLDQDGDEGLVFTLEAMWEPETRLPSAW